MVIGRRSWFAIATVGALNLAVAATGAGISKPAPAYAVSAPNKPTSGWVATAAIPDPSESLALDTSTGNVFAMTEAESDNDGGVDTDAPVAAAVPQCGEDVHDIAVINGGTGAVERTIAISGEAEYMAVDPNLHQLYVPQYNDEGPAAPQCLAVVNVDPASATAWTVQYYPIPFTYKDTGFQYDPTGVAVDLTTGIAYLGAKMPEIELEEGGEGAIMAFDGHSNTFLNAIVPAGDDPESVVFNRAAGKSGRVYAANEDEGTLTVTSAITAGAGGAWDTAAFRGGAFTLGPIFPDECPAGTYQPREADKLAVDDRMNKNMVYLTDDRYRVAAIPGDAMDTTNVRILALSPNQQCPTSPYPEIYNYANNLVIAPKLGTVTRQGPAGLLYVTSENYLVSIVDLASFTKTGELEIRNGSGATATPAGHIDWPVINPTTSRFYVSDELYPAVYIYDLGRSPTGTKK